MGETVLGGLDKEGNPSGKAVAFRERIRPDPLPGRQGIAPAHQRGDSWPAYLRRTEGPSPGQSIDPKSLLGFPAVAGRRTRKADQR